MALALPPTGCSAVLGARLVSKSTLLFCARLGAAGGLLCCSLAFTIAGLAGAHSGMGGAPSPSPPGLCPSAHGSAGAGDDAAEWVAVAVPTAVWLLATLGCCWLEGLTSAVRTQPPLPSDYV